MAAIVSQSANSNDISSISCSCMPFMQVRSSSLLRFRFLCSLLSVCRFARVWISSVLRHTCKFCAD